MRGSVSELIITAKKRIKHLLEKTVNPYPAILSALARISSADMSLQNLTP